MTSFPMSSKPSIVHVHIIKTTVMNPQSSHLRLWFIAQYVNCKVVTILQSEHEASSALLETSSESWT